MRKVKTGNRRKDVDYDYKEYVFAILKYGKKYFIIKDKDEYTLLGDEIRDYEGRKECIERIISDRTNIKLDEYEEYVTIDEYVNLEPYKGVENFTTYYLIYLDNHFKYNKIKDEEIVLVTADELEKYIQISYQKEAIKILLGRFILN